MPVSYRDIAAALRREISEGRYQPGDKLPMLTELQAQWGAGYQTVRSAIALLEQQGLVEAVRRRGTVVRDRPERRRITRSRQVFRDERGYYFDPTAQPWVALEAPNIGWGAVPGDLAELMGLAPGTEVLIRDRVMGDPETRTPRQLTTSYLPSDLARGTRLAEADSGPGGIYDRLEEMGLGPLRWSEGVSARMPSPAETEALHLPADIGIPLLRVVRLTTSPTGQVLEVNDTRMNAEQFEIGYTIRRHATAKVAGSESTDDLDH